MRRKIVIDGELRWVFLAFAVLALALLRDRPDDEKIGHHLP